VKQEEISCEIEVEMMEDRGRREERGERYGFLLLK
jgi:hypothetical protein